MEEDQYRNVFKFSLINQVRIQTPCDPPVTCIQDYMTIHDFNIAMVSGSIGLFHYVVVDRIIGNLIVSMT